MSHLEYRSKFTNPDYGLDRAPVERVKVHLPLSRKLGEAVRKLVFIRRNEPYVTFESPDLAGLDSTEDFDANSAREFSEP